ncbi:hypothetical protein DV736_g1722, partial [Chaetothyriales sp. CBS 134916]
MSSHVVPVLSVVYLMHALMFVRLVLLGLSSSSTLLDRTNIANAAIFGMQEELVGNQHNTAVTVFFPHVWLSICAFVFGTGNDDATPDTNFAGLITTRVFLGLFETGMFPGAFYIMSHWYKRQESQKRFYILRLLDGLGRRINTLALMVKSGIERRITPLDVLDSFKDIKFILAALMYFGLIVPAYSYTYFAPSIIKSYGYSATETPFHSVPLWAAASGFSMLVAFFSDTLRHRFLSPLYPCFICLSSATSVLYAAAVMMQNRQRESTHDVGFTEYEKAALGDTSPDFRYLL